MLGNVVTFPFTCHRNEKKASALQNMVIQLRKICQHPFVFQTTEQDIDPGSLKGGATDKVWRCSGKFELLDRILPKLFKTNHKASVSASRYLQRC